MSAPFGRRLALTGAAGALALPVVALAGTPDPDAALPPLRVPLAALPAPPAPEPLSAALRAYHAVMATHGAVNSGPDWDAVEDFCCREIAAIDTLADEPSGGLVDLLRKVVVIGDRCASEGWEGLMDCESALVAAVRDDARELLRDLTGEG